MAVNNKTRRWRGHDVDAGLDPAWLRKLNSIKGGRVTSTCEGHRGPDNKSHFAISFRGLAGEKRAILIARRLAAADTYVHVSSWGGPDGSWVVRVNGKWRKDHHHFGGEANMKKYPIKTASLYVANKGRKSPAWWERTLAKL